MRLLHGLAKIHASFDDPNLVSRAGLVPVMALAQRAGLTALAGEHVAIADRCGVNPHLKVPCLVAGMIAGADSIDDMDLLRHGAMPALFGGVRAPSTLGSFLRSFTWGNVLQLGKVNRLLLAELARGVAGSPVGPTLPPHTPYPIAQGFALYGDDSGQQGAGGPWSQRQPGAPLPTPPALPWTTR